MKVQRNGRRRNDEWFGEKQRKGRRKRCPGKKEEEGVAESRVRGAKTLARVEKRKNREDESMIIKGTNAISEKSLNRPRKKKNHTFESVSYTHLTLPTNREV